ncbi:MAG: hypothetical protein ACMUJJ_08205 [Roseicyclus sp.]|uniref:hypothetical protein n=1 Tax=Roseicyclus sp. TaxID=1914329 RepID=UPI003A884D5B
MEEYELFATLSFKGERFEGRYLPVGTLPSISAYQETLIEMAKAIWREENPDRPRLPKGFSSGFELGLEGIGEGSKVARLPRRLSEGADLLQHDSLDDIFLEAQERIATIVIAANKNSAFDPLPDNVILPFERLRKCVERSELIEINPISHGKKRVGKFPISQIALEKIINRSRARVNKAVDDIGFVVGISESPSLIRISSPKGVFSYPIPWSDLRSAADISIGKVVSFSIFAETDASDCIRRVISTSGVSGIAHSDNITRSLERIKEISKLSVGWLEGAGQAISKSAAIRAQDMAPFLVRKFGTVAVFPEQSGGIQFEWTLNNYAISLLCEEEHYLLGASDLASDKFREKSFRGTSFALLRDTTRIEKFVGRAGET